MRAERYPTKEKAAVRVYGKTGSMIASIKNVSKTGACIEWEEGFDIGIEMGDMIRMTVVLKAINRRHQLSAEVVWKDGNQSGVNFIPAEQVLEKMVDRTGKA